MNKGGRYKKTRGFSLIELIIVIAIIGILVAIVLNSVNSARQKAVHARTNAHVQQYVDAIAIYQTEHLELPVTACSSLQYYCLGHFEDGACGLNNRTPENSELNAKIQEAIRALPPGHVVIADGEGVLEGPEYGCGTDSSAYTIRWYLKGNAECVLTGDRTDNTFVSKAYNTSTNHTSCFIHGTLQ